MLLTLRLTGVLRPESALRWFLGIEVPLLVILATLTVLRFRRGGRSSAGADLGLLDRVAQEEPLLRPAVAELRSFASLGLAMVGRRAVPHGATPFSYTNGSFTLPAVVSVLSIAELAFVHVLVPWPWLRVVLLVLTVWSLLIVLGLFAARRVHPHLVSSDTLCLRWGAREVVVTRLDNVLSADLRTSHAYSQPHAEDERLVLTQFQSTNVVLRLKEPVAAAAPVAKKQRPHDFRVRHILLHVDDPDSFLMALRSSPSVAP
ncbi:MAG TPA: hypothetical protein VHO27_10015, partial [Angustibacter sp.]|nr:hypothetical protein [Angustibacter sp.]